MVQFSNAFWHGNEAFKKVVLRMKMLVSHLCCTPIARVSLVLDSCCSCLTHVALMSLVSHSCLSRLSLVLSIRLHRNLVEIYFSLSVSLFFSIRTFLVLQNDQSFSWFLWKNCLLFLSQFRHSTLINWLMFEGEQLWLARLNWT